MRISNPQPETQTSTDKVMLDIVYVTENKYTAAAAQKSDGKSGQDFVMVGREPLTATSLVSASPLSLIASTSPLLFPIGLLANAISSSPSIGSMLKSKSDTNTDEVDSAQLELAAYVAYHSMTKNDAKSRGYRFQPGHPVVGKAYRRHPLADYPNTETGDLYIPSDSYDAILLEERESELLKLLVDLGATKITITKRTSNNQHNSTAAGLKVDAGIAGGGGLSGAYDSQQNTNSLDVREFSLSGKRWQEGHALNKNNYFWLSYEPSWKAVVFARENGGCLTASLEIKESTSFSTDKGIELSVKAKMAEVTGSVKISNSGDEEKIYLVRAEFSPLIAGNQTTPNGQTDLSVTTS
ncbi:hypothetical protein NJC38_02185 [Pseudomonas sp. 21LCFQ010]|uniref:hypothetical protein n=1 Tax=Pseudomonas sp. 21LCFQ010 TaxID=2957506 RepID=UPI002096E5D4|nr:hypothetical protein [Pseudomonas sp. 21LCFQ010]MCO8160960.1 hypothetical protein [Pseudomonas sp. 21LCFQ010]